jgi:hypothetical protein
MFSWNTWNTDQILLHELQADAQRQDNYFVVFFSSFCLLFFGGKFRGRIKLSMSLVLFDLSKKL